jgi:hypothetical protein
LQRGSRQSIDRPIAVDVRVEILKVVVVWYTVYCTVR